ncbi:MAG: anthranilate synthase [Pseudomonadota bacterium]
MSGTHTPFVYETEGGVTVTRSRVGTAYDDAVDAYVRRLDRRRGAVFSSNYEYPGRYTRWDTAIVDPPLGIASAGRQMRVEAYNGRGVVLLNMLEPVLVADDHVKDHRRDGDILHLTIKEPDGVIAEEDRSRAPTVFSVLRAIVGHFKSDADSNLALYGAFGYDIAFQFDAITTRLPRPDDQRDMVLYLPDEILVVDHHAASAWKERYDFADGQGLSTEGLPREGADDPFQPGDHDPGRGDHVPGEYAALVEKAKEKFRRGDLFEVVPGQTFTERCTNPPSAISRKLKEINPSPYSFFINLGEQEYLVGASPEMFVRVEKRRIETCPISGTIRRGRDPIEDSEQILTLLNSKKDESELTMCSDVDRNDKSRVCEPGSVKVIGRRQIEMYSRLIHTVDHIEGRLRADMDAFDGFLSHAWAVTVTGAPKLWAMRFIEEHEKSPRAWYGGAVGMVGFNGNMNTGLTLRTVRIKNGIAEVRAGATLLNDSNPQEEEAETELKASAMLAAVREAGQSNAASATRAAAKVGEGRRILLVDHEDSFVHTLANYFRQTGAAVRTVRSPVSTAVVDAFAPDLVVLSPGPGNPQNFNCDATIKLVRGLGLPIFGVCLGLQALVESYGGTLAQLDDPMHGKPSRISVEPNSLTFSGLNGGLTVGRYHSLYADAAQLPAGFKVTARTADDVIMGIEHTEEPIAAVQFHPESIMSLGQDAGMRMIENIVAHLK